MVRYRFSGVALVADASKLLESLKQYGAVGVAVLPTNTVEVDFAQEPSQDQLNSVKDFLGAKIVEKVEEEEVTLL